jgi:hypothetical protein
MDPGLEEIDVAVVEKKKKTRIKMVKVKVGSLFSFKQAVRSQPTPPQASKENRPAKAYWGHYKPGRGASRVV